MNCRPGDLAVIVRDKDARLIGKLLTCRYLDPAWLACGVLTWEFEPVSRGLPDPADYTMDDADLKPLRDPGDDAVDESLLWLRVPVKEHA